jgi:hypothetical protein
MPLVEHDHVIETLASDAADEPLYIRRLPRTTRRDLDFFDTHVAHALLERRAVDGVAISEQILRRLIPGTGLDDLLCGPLCRGVLGDVDLATVMSSFCNSPTMQGEPQVGLARHMSWISSRTAWEMDGRPGLPL